MTRINVIDPALLTDQHLLAEIREIARPINKVLNGKLQGKMPAQYTLGTGHETFFRDKLGYIKNRHRQLVEEAHRRGLKASHLQGLPAMPPTLWKPSKRDAQVNIDRLQERFAANGNKPASVLFYRYNKQVVSKEMFDKLCNDALALF